MRLQKLSTAADAERIHEQGVSSPSMADGWHFPSIVLS